MDLSFFPLLQFDLGQLELLLHLVLMRNSAFYRTRQGRID
jgi:hypothetical protein